MLSRGFARVASSIVVRRISFSLVTERGRQRGVRPVSQASETCRNGSRGYVRERQQQQRNTTATERVCVPRVQTPRHFVHPWIICGAMPNASTATAGLSICMRSVRIRALLRGCSCTPAGASVNCIHVRARACSSIPKTPRPTNPARSLRAIVAFE